MLLLTPSLCLPVLWSDKKGCLGAGFIWNAGQSAAPSWGGQGQGSVPGCNQVRASCWSPEWLLWGTGACVLCLLPVALGL